MIALFLALRIEEYTDQLEITNMSKVTTMADLWGSSLTDKEIWRTVAVVAIWN